MFSQKIRKEIGKVIIKKQKEKILPEFDFSEIVVEYPKQRIHGHYATNVALIIAKKVKKKPIEIANYLKSELENNYLFEKIEIVEPGFINFFISEKALLDGLRRILKEKEKYGKSDVGKSKTIIIDYSSPNIAKPFSVGHLRSTIIGQAIYNLYKLLGFKVIGDNHLGDWGTQFGKLIYAIKKWGDEKEIEKDPIKNLVSLYVRFHQEAEKNPQLEEKGREWFRKLERGEKEARRLWKKCVKWSLKEFEKVYKILKIKQDLVLGESFYHSLSEEVVEEALKRGVAKESQGALVIPFPEEKLPPLLIKKSDGTTLYSTRDLAAIKYRMEKFKPWKIIYEVGADQKLYFQQLFWAAELLGLGKRDKYVHIAHGMIRLPEGKMSTRKGRVILLEDLLEEAIRKAKEIIKKKNPQIKENERKKIAETIGVGAVKYNILSKNPETDIIFKWEEALNLEGNSGPYLQYAYVRAKGIIKRFKRKREKVIFKQRVLTAKDLDFLFQLTKFPEVIEEGGKKYSPNIVANYLFDLAREFNKFYESVPVFQERKEDLRVLRLLLVKAFSQIIKNGLNVLGIDVVEKM